MDSILSDEEFANGGLFIGDGRDRKMKKEKAKTTTIG